MFTLPSLNYDYAALDPHIDALTMEIHHTKHHQAYIDKANAALKETPFTDTTAEEIIVKLSDFPAEKQTAIRNNVGGHINHSFFWKLLNPTPSSPSDEFARKISENFGSMDKFKESFEAAALGRFGSGWTWLVRQGDELIIMSTPNQDSPITEGLLPVIGLDVWEHAYYLQYQNRRPDYVKAFWNILDWKTAEDNYHS